MSSKATTISKRLKRKAEKDSSRASAAKQSKKKKDQEKFYTMTCDIDKRMKEIELLESEYPLAAAILQIETKLCDELMKLDYGEKVTHVYNPVDYAYKPHIEWYRKHCHSSVQVLLIGENPGPFGGAQTGVPFGDMKKVTEFLGVRGEVQQPDKQHPKRPILGFDISRSEGSGTRLWSFIEDEFKTADTFFEKAFVYNFCPLIYMSESGSNVTPSQMSAAVKSKLHELCDKALSDIIDLFPNCHTVAGIGRYTEDRAKRICKEKTKAYIIKYMMHPSPRNPEASKNWAANSADSFRDYGLL